MIFFVQQGIFLALEVSCDGARTNCTAGEGVPALLYAQSNTDERTSY